MYDNTCKYLAETYPADFAVSLLGEPIALTRLEPRELSADPIGRAFLPAYAPIAEKRRETPYGEEERQFQLYRRGRYVEFNLVYDRGTIFGLQTNGHTESILMSLPPLVRWQYYQPAPGSPEADIRRVA